MAAVYNNPGLQPFGIEVINKISLCIGIFIGFIIQWKVGKYPDRLTFYRFYFNPFFLLSYLPFAARKRSEVTAVRFLAIFITIKKYLFNNTARIVCEVIITHRINRRYSYFFGKVNTVFIIGRKKNHF